uniref:Uncharacterized protein n=1 Tax=Globodera rostochiensis TaxID=31243 RepID=A0A914H3B0_GLORO
MEMVQFQRLLFSFLIFVRLSLEQSAELEDLQRLCPGLKGVFCSHCDHKSVEAICPNECNFCSNLRLGGLSRFVGNSPQNLIDLKRQCANIRSWSKRCFLVASINELCVEECLDCEAANVKNENMLELFGTRQKLGNGFGIGNDRTLGDGGKVFEPEVGEEELAVQFPSERQGMN